MVYTGAGGWRSVAEEEERVVAGGEVAESAEGRERGDEQGTQTQDQAKDPRVTVGHHRHTHTRTHAHSFVCVCRVETLVVCVSPLVVCVCVCVYL